MKRVVFFRRKASWGWCEPSTEEKDEAHFGDAS